MWHSSTAELKSSNNITGFKNDRVDALIEKARGEFDVEVRHDIIQEVLNSLKKHMLAPRTSIRSSALLETDSKTLCHVLGDSNEEWAAVDYWWNDEFLAEDLEAARESGSELPPPPQ